MENESEDVFLYGAVKNIPLNSAQRMDQDGQDCLKAVYHIVQGKRRDPSRGVKRLEGTTAIGITAQVTENRVPFFVDFDNALFEPKTSTVWQETKNSLAGGLYGAYQQTSKHHQSIRPYYKPARYDEEPITPKVQTLGFESIHCFSLITKLL